jgi:hypothetical protein
MALAATNPTKKETVKRVLAIPTRLPVARRPSVEGMSREELLIILGGRADERALARRSQA